MKVKEITYAMKKGLPNFSSVMASMTITVEKDEDVNMAWEKAKHEVELECNTEPSWMNKKQVNEQKDDRTVDPY